MLQKQCRKQTTILTIRLYICIWTNSKTAGKIMQNDGNRGCFSPPASFQINP